VRNFNEGVDLITNSGLAGLPTANKLWFWKCDQGEADVDPSMTLLMLTKTAGTVALSATGRTCVARTIDCGAMSFPGLADTTAVAIIVSTDDPAVGGAKLVAIQDIVGGGVAYDAVSNGPLTVDGFTIKIAYEGEL